MSISPVSAPELFVLAHLLAHDPDRRQWARSILIDLVQACSCTDDPIQLICDLHEVLLTPDTSRFSLDRITLQVEPPDRHLLVAALIAIGRHTECRLKAGAIDSRVIVAQRQMMLVVTLLWQWPTERLNQAWEDHATLSKAIADLRQQSSPIASVLVSYLERDLTPEPLTVRTESPEPTVADEALIELPTGALLDSPQIVGAIASNQHIAQEDYNWTRRELEPVAQAFATLTRDLGQRAKELEKVGQGKTSVKQAAAKQMAELYDKLERTRTQDLENLRTILKRKRDAIGHFTLAMMGRTKAGKSTLFATLLGSGYDGIGTGQQRTTRENRVYELENGIRLVDTPGIAAAGGEADALEALKAVDGADLICYVVTSDSIQESEFEFLRKLKDKTKPLLILLNVQKDLTNATRRKLFLKNPDKLMSGDDIEGHTSRILRYAREHYASESIVVLPVMLLAAQLARQEDDRELCSQLYRASRIQSFLDWVEGAIVNYGTLIASQTIIGETAVSLVPYRNEIEAQRDRCRYDAQKLRETKATFIRKIEQSRKDIIDQIKAEIAVDYQAILKEIPSFARNNWEKDPSIQKKEWQEVERKIRISEKINATIKLISASFNQKNQEILEEIGQDLEFTERFSEKSHNHTNGFTGKTAGFDFQFFTKLAGILATVAGTIMSFMSGIGLAAGIITFVGAGLGMSSGMAKSKQQRQSETCKEIEKALRSEVSKVEHEKNEQLKQHFTKICESLANEVNKYFDAVIEDLNTANVSLDNAQDNLRKTIQILDRGVSLRIYDWCHQNKKPFNQVRLDQSIKTVQRNPGKLQIQLTQSMTQLPPKQRQTECSQILGIDVQFSQKP
jgi:hypothetical protein